MIIHSIISTGVGGLKVYVMWSTGPQQTVFNMSGNHGDRWILGQATVSSRQNFFLLFEGIRGTSYNGDIAIDDIGLTTGSCGSQPVTGSTQAPTPYSTASKKILE